MGRRKAADVVSRVSGGFGKGLGGDWKRLEMAQAADSGKGFGFG